MSDLGSGIAWAGFWIFQGMALIAHSIEREGCKESVLEEVVRGMISDDDGN